MVQGGLGQAARWHHENACPHPLQTQGRATPPMPVQSCGSRILPLFDALTRVLGGCEWLCGDVYADKQQKKRVSMLSDHSPFRTPQMRQGGVAEGSSGGRGGSSDLRTPRNGGSSQGASGRREGSSSGQEPRSFSGAHPSWPSSSNGASRPGTEQRSAGRGSAGLGWQHSPTVSREQLKMIARRRLGAMGSGSGF